MKIIFLQLLATLLFLSGCASVSMAPQQEPLPRAAQIEKNRPQPAKSVPLVAAPIRIAPSYPSGPLSEIAATTAGSQAVAATIAPADLWARIRRGFAMPELENDLVRDREQWYSTRPDYILQMTERSRKYMFYIVEELEMRNMPSELALLPFVESAFNPQAVSHAKAAGMWQFMPATGRNFDLKQNVFRDDRRDVQASTRAALDYLQKLYVMFGDWHLALAAYNWGEGSVGRAIAKNRLAGLGVSYTELNMPMETRFYVPKLMALKNIVATPAAFNAKLPLIENHPFFTSVTLKRDIDVALAAKLAEVSEDDFKALNPAASRPVILAAGTPQILLPWDNAAIFQRNLEAYSGGRLASWTVWLAPTTLKTAEVARQVGMTEEALRALNNIPPRVLIKAGSSLLVPRSSHLETDVGVHTADNGQMLLAPDIVLKKTMVKAGKKDTVATLALRYGVSVANLAEWNKTTPAGAFKPGQAVALFMVAAPQALAKSKPSTKTKSDRPQAKAKVKTKAKAVRVAKK